MSSCRHSHHPIGPLVPFHAIQETQKGPLRELFPDGGEGFTGVVQLIVAWRNQKNLWKPHQKRTRIWPFSKIPHETIADSSTG
jgi:hypothetical protein